MGMPWGILSAQKKQEIESGPQLESLKINRLSYQNCLRSDSGAARVPWVLFVAPMNKTYWLTYLCPLDPCVDAGGSPRAPPPCAGGSPRRYPQEIHLGVSTGNPAGGSLKGPPKGSLGCSPVGSRVGSPGSSPKGFPGEPLENLLGDPLGNPLGHPLRYPPGESP